MKGPLAIAIAICFFAFALGFRLPQDSSRGGSFPPSSTGPYNPERPKGPLVR